MSRYSSQEIYLKQRLPAGSGKKNNALIPRKVELKFPQVNFKELVYPRLQNKVLEVRQRDHLFSLTHGKGEGCGLGPQGEILCVISSLAEHDNVDKQTGRPTSPSQSMDKLNKQTSQPALPNACVCL
jgi:hypothetical protein